MSQQIEELGMKVQWREANKASRFLIERAFDIDDKKTWDDGINWLYKMCCKFKELVEKYSNNRINDELYKRYCPSILI